MKEEIKEKWVTALTSGEYAQGQRALNTNNTFCCLGVLCDLYAKAHGMEWTPNEDFPDRFALEFPDIPFFPKYGMPDSRVYEWAGINMSYTNDESSFDFVNDLATANDAGATFAEIADRITKTL